MREVIAAVLTLCLAGCATAAEREVDRMKTSAARGIATARSCDTQVEATPEYQSIKGTSKNAPVNDGLAMDADVLWFRRGFVGAGSTFLAS